MACDSTARPQPTAHPDCTEPTAPTILRADGFAHQHGARGPLAAETKTEQRAGDQQLIEILHEGADQREE